jgi:hypothetical protein
MEEDEELEEFESTVKYSFIVQEEDYEDEDYEEPQPWDPSEIFFVSNSKCLVLSQVLLFSWRHSP